MFHPRVQSLTAERKIIRAADEIDDPHDPGAPCVHRARDNERTPGFPHVVGKTWKRKIAACHIPCVFVRFARKNLAELLRRGDALKHCSGNGLRKDGAVRPGQTVFRARCKAVIVIHTVRAPAEKTVEGHGLRTDVVAREHARTRQAGQGSHQFKPDAVAPFPGAPDRDPHVRPGTAVCEDVPRDRGELSVCLRHGKLQGIRAEGTVIKVEIIPRVHERQPSAPVLIEKGDDAGFLVRVRETQHRRRHSAALPPVMGSVTPVMNPASSLKRNSMAGTTSDGRALRFIGLASAEA